MNGAVRRSTWTGHLQSGERRVDPAAAGLAATRVGTVSTATGRAVGTARTRGDRW